MVWTFYELLAAWYSNDILVGFELQLSILKYSRISKGNATYWSLRTTAMEVSQATSLSNWTGPNRGCAGSKPIPIAAFISWLHGANDMTGRPKPGPRYGNTTWNTTFHLPVDRNPGRCSTRGNHIDANCDQIRRSDLPQTAYIGKQEHTYAGLVAAECLEIETIQTSKKITRSLTGFRK